MLHSIASIVTSKFAQESKRRIEAATMQFIADNIEWSLRIAETLCESEIEKLFLLAWIEKLEATKMNGGFHSWVSKYYVVGKGTGWLFRLRALSKKSTFTFCLTGN